MNDSLSKINTLQTTLATQKKSLSDLVKPVSVKTTIFKSILKYLSAGVIGGALGSIIILMLIIILSGKVLYEKDVEEISNTKILGVLPMKQNTKKPVKFDSFISKKIDTSFGMNEINILNIIINNIIATNSNIKSIILVGDNVSELKNQMENITDEIRINSTSNIKDDIAGVENLKESDAVILVAERNATRLSDICKTMKEIKAWNRPILGSIIL